MIISSSFLHPFNVWLISKAEIRTFCILPDFSFFKFFLNFPKYLHHHPFPLFKVKKNLLNVALFIIVILHSRTSIYCLPQWRSEDIMDIGKTTNSRQHRLCCNGTGTIELKQWFHENKRCGRDKSGFYYSLSNNK